MDEDGSIAATAMIIYEDEYDDSPISTGLLDSEGDEICRIPWRDTVPMGFHYLPEHYDEDGNYIGDEEYEEE
jgi:hypothetical protein